MGINEDENRILISVNWHKSFSLKIAKDISKSKIEGLKKNYNIDDAKALAFFSEHEKTDVYHSQACERIIAFIPPEHEEKALAAAGI